MRVKIEVSIPDTFGVTKNGLRYHVRKALKQYVLTHEEHIVPELRDALADPQNTDWPMNSPEDRSGLRRDRMFNPDDTPDKGWVTQFVLDAVNHETAHTRIAMSQMKSEMRNLEERLNQRITEGEQELAARIEKLEEGDTALLLHYTEKIGDHDERLVKRENHANVTSQNIIKLIHMLADSGNTEAQQMLGMVEGK